MKIEALLTMGLAHGIDYERLFKSVGGSTTSASERIAWQDVMQAVAMVPKGQRAALYLKCAPQMVSAQELAAFCYGLLTVLQRYEAKGGRSSLTPHSPQQWHTPAERAIHKAQGRHFERQAAIVRTALAEYQDPRICSLCKGGGKIKVHIEGKGVVEQGCPKCGGQGWRAWSDNRRAKAIGGDRNAYAGQIAPAYLYVLNACTEQYRKGSQAFKAALFGPTEEQGHAIESRLQARA